MTQPGHITRLTPEDPKAWATLLDPGEDLLWQVPPTLPRPQNLRRNIWMLLTLVALPVALTMGLLPSLPNATTGTILGAEIGVALTLCLWWFGGAIRAHFTTLYTLTNKRAFKPPSRPARSVANRRATQDAAAKDAPMSTPMITTFTNARLINPETGTDETGSLTIEGGIITAVNGPDAGEVINCDGKCLAPGIVDMGVKIGEPGERHKESFRTAGAAAAAGGVTTMVIRPDTTPAVDTPETLEFVTRRAGQAAPVNVFSMAALTKGRKGREMVEVGFLQDAGAVAFTDCDHVVENPKTFSRAMTYAKSLGALVIAHPQDPTLSAGAAVTSGKFASLRGLPAVSPMAERMGLERDMALVEMSGARYHADSLSTAAALPVLERAKADGLDVSAGVNIHHLTLNEFDVGDYRTFFKQKPPLRSEDDRLAMVEAVASGLIDVVCSMHTPQDEESKRLPFEEAASGAVGLETLLPAAMRLVHAGLIALPTLWRAMSLNPAQRLGLPGGRLTEGAPADLVLFDPNAPFVLDRFALKSKSKNTPFDGTRMEGRVIGTWVAGTRVFG